MMVVQVIGFAALQERNYNIYLNHTSLLRAILLHSGVPEDKLSHASSILCDAMVSFEQHIYNIPKKHASIKYIRVCVCVCVHNLFNFNNSNVILFISL